MHDSSVIDGIILDVFVYPVDEFNSEYDPEGYFRWHWLLFDSLEIYCDVMRLHYFGPKKALRLMEQTDEEAFKIYSKALKEFKGECLSDWISYLKRLL